MTTENKIPDGYMKNSRGDLVKAENIKPIDLLKDQAAVAIAEKAKELHMELIKFKRIALDDISSLIEVAGAEHGVILGGEKGNTTLTSFDGRYKIQRSYQEKIDFGPELQVAKEMFERYAKHKEVELGEDGLILIDMAFRRSRNGQISVSRLLELLQYPIKHPDWLKACEILTQASSVVGMTVYVNVFERVNDSDRYQPIHLSLAAVGGGYAR